MTRWWRAGVRGLVGCATLVCLLGALALAGADARAAGFGAAAGPTCGQAWAGAWRAAAQEVTAPPLAGRTVRMIVQPQVTGSQVRIRLSNAHGTGPLRIAAASAARSAGGAGLVRGTTTRVAFGGLAGVVVPAGGEVVSDPVPLVAEAGRPLAVSLGIAAAPDVLTGHTVALQTSYVSAPGDFALAPDGVAFGTRLDSWLVLTGVDVLAPRPVNALVAIGDSITDGVGTATGRDERWTDALAQRLAAEGGPAMMSVLNTGISRNRLLGSGPADGDAPLARFARDVTGASDVVLNIGTNDVAAGHGSDEVVAGLIAFAERARTDGHRVFLTTITPSRTGAHGTSRSVATRAAVNDWIRTRGAQHADGVFDFAAAVADPADPSRLARGFDAGDGLHLSAAGYRALADAVDPAALTGSPCLADDTAQRVLLSTD